MKSIAEMCKAVATPKRILKFEPWTPVNNTLRLSANFEHQGVIMPGLTFMAMCLPERPDEQVSICIMAEIMRKSRCIARVDWRGAQHVNRKEECGQYRFLDAGRTHFHDPDIHHAFDFDELFTKPNDLPAALPIDPPPESFEELLARGGDLLHIDNLKDMPVPKWEPRASLA